MKKLNREEKFVAELTWGSVPIDEEWARNSNLFKQNMNAYLEGKFDELKKYLGV